MLTLDEALQRLITNVRPLSDTETLDSFEALGRVLAASKEGADSGDQAC